MFQRTSKNTFKHPFPSISLSSGVVNKLECLCIDLDIVLLMFMNFAIHKIYGCPGISDAMIDKRLAADEKVPANTTRSNQT